MMIIKELLTMNSQWNWKFFGSFSENSGVFSGDVSDILLGVAPVDLVHGSVEIYVLRLNLGLSLEEQDFTLGSLFQGICNSFSIFLGTDDSWGKSLFGWEFEELVFPDVLGVVVIGKELSLILDIGSDEGRVGVDLPDLILGWEIVLFGVGICIMIVLDGGGEEEVGSLCYRRINVRFYHTQQQVSST